MSIINTPLPKGEIYPTTLRPKGETEPLRFAKGQREELTAEYNFTKPKYMLEDTTESINRKKFFARCVVKDQKRGNKFSTLSDGESKIRSAEHEVARKILSILGKMHFFSKEKNICNRTDESYVI